MTNEERAWEWLDDASIASNGLSVIHYESLAALLDTVAAEARAEVAGERDTALERVRELEAALDDATRRYAEKLRIAQTERVAPRPDPLGEALNSDGSDRP